MAAVLGGMSKHEQFKELRAGADIAVATPGRLMDLITMKACNLHRTTMLVLDEADRMIDIGFEQQVCRRGGVTHTTLTLKPYTLHPMPYATMHPSPYTLCPMPYTTVHPAPYTLCPTPPCTLHPTPYLHPMPCTTMHPTPYTPNSKPCSPPAPPYTLHPTL